jgi:hemerythrin-like domain-containing protein
VGVDPIRAQLAADHRVLDDLFARLVHDVSVLSHGDLQIVWCELEHRLLSHMDVEEQVLWPLLEEGHRAALDGARSDHARIRGAVNALGAAVELRTVRESDLKELMRFLHHHAEREDAFLYRFACERAPATVQFRMATTLRTAAHAAHVAALKTTANRAGLHEESAAPKPPSASR